jgi:hypothetical protein
VIPAKQLGFDRLLVMAKDMTSQKLFGKCTELFNTWKYCDDLDVITSVPKTDKDYAIWVRDREEADEEMKNKSANDLDREGIKGNTLPERLVDELKFFKETGRHLDQKNATLCADSHDPANNSVPRVCWHPRGGVDEFCVNWSYPDDGFEFRRSRAVIFA